MIKKKKTKDPETINEEPTKETKTETNENADAVSTEPMPEIAELKGQIEELNGKISEMGDKYLRLYSEFDNYRKRTAREKIEMMKTASEEIIVALLPVLDDFERALSAFAGNGSNDANTEGVKLIYNKLKNILVSRGLQEMDALNQTFDTDFHEAISHLPVDDAEKKDKIIEVVQKGYKLGEKVIRYAKVVVGS